MPDAVKVYRTAAFSGLATEIKRFGALSWHEALALFEQELVVNALRRKVCAERATEIGTVLYLLHQGRKLVGMAGAFTPTIEGLMDAVCLRQAAQELENAGFTLDLTVRKRNIVYRDSDKKYLVLAQHHGYSVAAVRRLYKALIDTREYSEIHLYTYLNHDGLEALAQPLYRPISSKPLDPHRLRLHRLIPPGESPEPAAPRELN